MYLRCELDRLMIFSRNVFWGATKPRRPPGIFFFGILEFDCSTLSQHKLAVVPRVVTKLQHESRQFYDFQLYSLSWMMTMMMAMIMMMTGTKRATNTLILAEWLLNLVCKWNNSLNQYPDCFILQFYGWSMILKCLRLKIPHCIFPYDKHRFIKQHVVSVSVHFSFFLYT